MWSLLSNIYFWIGAVILLLVLMKVSKIVNFLFHFLMFGQVFLWFTLFAFPFVKLFRVYHGPPNESISAFWVHLCCRYFRCSFENVGTQELYKESCMYLCPHRSWSDFFIHRKLVDNRGSNLSRWLVLVAFPMFWVVTKFDRSAFFFNRSKARGNSDKFYAWMKEELDASHLPSVINYPEGTRNLKKEPLSVKRGGIYMAYAYQIPIQVVMSKGNDDIVNEKGFKMGFGKKITYKYGKLMKPGDYETRELFFDDVEKEFTQLFSDIYSSQ